MSATINTDTAGHGEAERKNWMPYLGTAECAHLTDSGTVTVPKSYSSGQGVRGESAFSYGVARCARCQADFIFPHATRLNRRAVLPLLENAQPPPKRTKPAPWQTSTVLNAPYYPGERKLRKLSNSASFIPSSVWSQDQEPSRDNFYLGCITRTNSVSIQFKSKNSPVLSFEIISLSRVCCFHNLVNISQNCHNKRFRDGHSSFAAITKPTPKRTTKAANCSRN
jgi:hypothetical protein